MGFETIIEDLEVECDFCQSEEKYPLVLKDVTLFTSFENDGTIEQATVLCSQCRKANSYGDYGCPRLNRNLPIRKAKVLIRVYADERIDAEEVKTLYNAGADMEDASAIVMCQGLGLSWSEVLDFHYLTRYTVGAFGETIIFYHA